MISNTDGTTFIYSGKPNGVPRSSGVGFLLSKDARRALIMWKPHSDRFISIRLRTRARNIYCIQCYAPTELADLREKEEFYSQLEKIIRDVPSGDILVLMGDFNAQLGPCNINLERVMGSQGMGRMNVNGELFAELCAKHNLTIGGTIFPHKRIHKVTWVSPDHRTETQIDHIAISRKWRGSLLDVRNRRGADGSSDHHLLVGVIRLKISAIRRQNMTPSPRQYDVGKLQQASVRERLVGTMRRRYEEVSERERAQWSVIRSILTESARQQIGYRQHKRKIWITDET
ncbi:craniofacial development protein 2-like [Calliphora vicina]|uniref:craniofacial development protein 2-like n=1 Tax=Calliphora vicina TaxID=7373 RepID=UPI00325AA5B6